MPSYFLITSLLTQVRDGDERLRAMITSYPGGAPEVVLECLQRGADGWSVVGQRIESTDGLNSAEFSRWDDDGQLALALDVEDAESAQEQVLQADGSSIMAGDQESVDEGWFESEEDEDSLEDDFEDDDDESHAVPPDLPPYGAVFELRSRELGSDRLRAVVIQSGDEDPRLRLEHLRPGGEFLPWRLQRFSWVKTPACRRITLLGWEGDRLSFELDGERRFRVEASAAALGEEAGT